jgi:hypothetical protein
MDNSTYVTSVLSYETNLQREMMSMSVCVLDEPKLCAMNPIQLLENISLTTIVGFQ